MLFCLRGRTHATNRPEQERLRDRVVRFLEETKDGEPTPQRDRSLSRDKKHISPLYPKKVETIAFISSSLSPLNHACDTSRMTGNNERTVALSRSIHHTPPRCCRLLPHSSSRLHIRELPPTQTTGRRRAEVRTQPSQPTTTTPFCRRTHVE